MKRYYNSKFDLVIEIKDYESLPVFKHKNKVLKPFLRRSNTRLMYPYININGHIELCHRIVAYSCLSKGSYFASKKRLNSQVGNYIRVDHKNGNTLDYRPSNLRYLTNSENVKHAVDYMQPISLEQIEQLKLNKFKDYDIKPYDKDYFIFN